jgi:hypothetical protein
VVSAEPLETLADELAESLRLAVIGIDGRTEPHACLAKPLAAIAFGVGSTKSPVPTGTGLWAILRTSADHTGKVLCVHNVSDEPQRFQPAPHLGAEANKPGTLLFLHGETVTSEAAGELQCELEPHGFVWLGLVTSPTGGNTP